MGIFFSLPSYHFLSYFISFKMAPLSGKLSELFTEQIALELANSQAYLQAAFWFDVRNFRGIASFLRAESHEERSHALKLADYLVKRDNPVVFGAVGAPKNDYDNAVEVFEAMLLAEEETSKRINALVNAAIEEKDHAAKIFLDWFVTEQVESEANIKSVLEKVKAYSSLKGLLYHLDMELKTGLGGDTPVQPIQV